MSDENTEEKKRPMTATERKRSQRQRERTFDAHSVPVVKTTTEYAAPAFSDEMWAEAEKWASTCQTRLNTQTYPMGPILNEDVAKALVYSGANLDRCAMLLGRKRRAIYERVHQTKELKALFEDITECRLDRIQEIQFRSAEIGDLQAGRFLLMTCRKDTFSTRQEQTGKDGASLQPPRVIIVKKDEDVRVVEEGDPNTAVLILPHNGRDDFGGNTQ